MYKVFFNDRIIFLSDKLPEIVHNGQDYLCAFENITDLKPQIRHFLDKGTKGNLHIFHDNKDELMDTFGKCFTRIDASGGLVRNGRGEYLLIYRQGMWDLPKGKFADKETPEDAALREVSEETGLTGMSINKFLSCSYHIYHLNDKPVLKKTAWYEMDYHGDEKPVPESKEDIEKVVWVKKKELEKYYSKSYPSIVELLRSCID